MMRRRGIKVFVRTRTIQIVRMKTYTKGEEVMIQRKAILFFFVAILVLSSLPLNVTNAKLKEQRDRVWTLRKRSSNRSLMGN